MTINNIDEIKNAMTGIGFSADEAEKQLNDLGRLVGLQTVSNILASYPDASVDENNFVDFIEGHKNDAAVIAARDSAIETITSSYFARITEKLPADQKEKFFSGLGLNPSPSQK